LKKQLGDLFLNNNYGRKEMKMNDQESEIKLQLLEYLQSYYLGVGFNELNDLVIDKNNCVLCGTCTSLCPRIGMNEKEPILLNYDPECSTCFRFCPQTYFPEDLFNKELFHNGTNKSYALGFYQKSIAAKSDEVNILKVAQNSGVVSSLLLHALETGLIDGVLLTGRDENWHPKPIIARTSDEILSCAGSKYTIAPSVITYKDAVYDLRLKGLAFVGMPCQIRAVRKLQLSSPLSEEYGKFKLIIGLYCSSNYSYDLMKLFVQGKLGIPLNKVKKVDISHGKFKVYTKKGLSKEVFIKEIKKYSWPSCSHCRDYSAEFADISIGSVGVSKNEWNSVLLRTDVGTSLFNDAVEGKKIILSNDIDLVRIEKEALRKKTKLPQTDKNLLNTLKFLNVSNSEINIYTTLMSLRNATEPILSKLLNIEHEVLKDSLQKLKHRGWIMAPNGSYSVVNPTVVISNEISELKKYFLNNIEKLKTDALTKLEKLYVQNYSCQLRFDENL
jgi:coenzyme F420 hydrogenase subunit beta